MKYCSLLIFLVSWVYANSQSNCSIQKDVDKFTDDISIKTQVSTDLNICPLIFGKLIKKTDTTHYLHFYLKTSYGTYQAKGVYVIFEDGEKWVKDDTKINVDYSNGKYSYQAFVYLSESDIERLKKTRITDIRVYDVPYVYPKKDAEFLMCGIEKVLAEPIK